MYPKFDRPGWDEYFMNIAYVVATRGNCIRRQVAAVIAKDNRIISTGYNGTPRGVENCCDGGCPRCASDLPSGVGLEECICAHGEENAILQAANYGVSLRGSVLYSTMSPCITCTRLIIAAGIKKVVYDKEYHLSQATESLFKEAGVVCEKLVHD